MKRFTVILLIVGSLFTGCSTYQFTGPRNISIDPGCPPAYTKEEINRITVYTVDKWVEKYGKPKDYDSLQYLSVAIDDQPVADGYYGLATYYGAPYVIVWAHSPNPNESSLVHEMIHVLQGLTNRDDDKSHSGSYWGEGFESPVKRGLAK